MSSILVIIDSRLRVSGTFDDYIIDVPHSLVNVRSMALAYGVARTPGGWAHRALYVDIEGLPPGVLYTRGGSGSGVLAGHASYVIPTQAAAGVDAVFKEETDYAQKIHLNPPASFARLRVRILDSDGVLAGLGHDSLFIIRVE
jgi:hypothetical protein